MIGSKFIHRLGAFALGMLVALMLAGGTPAWAEEPARFTGAASCTGCHAGQAVPWQQSHHAQAMQKATPETVLGDFNDASFTQGGLTTVFHRDGERFVVRTDGPDGAIADFPVAYTFGVAPLQQYLIALPGGRYQAFGLAWDSRTKAAGGQRWYALYPDQTLKAGDRLHWTGRDQTWNYMCASCHSTDVQKGYDLATDSYKTSFSDVNVGCEACHGPGSRHLAWAQAKPLPDDPTKGLVVSLPVGDHSVWVMNEATGIAERSKPATNAAEINVCATCHARAAPIVADSTAATPFLDAYLPALLEAGNYHPDGQIDGEVFEYGSFLQSRMHRAGVTCTDCHEPHAAQLRADGNALCGQCHMAGKFDVAAHTHHADGSAGAACVACHMPTKTYMGVDARRDHSIRVPRPDLSVTLAVPNACTQCHADKPAAWAADAVAGWFPNGRQTQPQYGQAIAAARAGRIGAAPGLDALIGDLNTPPIARASALLLLPRVATGASLPVWRQALVDPDPLVRQGAVRALSSNPSSQMLRDVAVRLDDPVRSVRIEAARALAGVDPQMLTVPQQAAYATAMRELVASEMVVADRPEAHLNLGVLAVRQHQFDQAEAEYRTALRLDPKFTEALINFADLDRMRGMDAQGADLLRQAIVLEPGNAEAHHALGLLRVRQRDYPDAIAELRRASALAPDDQRFVYTYAIALNATGDGPEALAVLQRAQQRFPANEEILSALVSFSRDRGDMPAALKYAVGLLRLHPNDVRLAMLVRDLEQHQPK